MHADKTAEEMKSHDGTSSDPREGAQGYTKAQKYSKGCGRKEQARDELDRVGAQVQRNP